MATNKRVIVMLGNGFDLAHGLRTSYHDFLENYVSEAIKLSQSGTHYNDGHLEIQPFAELKYDENDPPAKRIANMISHVKPKLRFNNHLLRSLYDKLIISNWVDVEREYYQHLMEILKKGMPEKEQEVVLDILHKNFDGIQQLLENYLINTINPLISKCEKPFEDIFSQLKNNKDSYSNLILNFNYTSTFEPYMVGIPHVPIYIHGKLENAKNPIIFGYGDDTTDQYKLLEDLDNNKYLEFVKSFMYLKTTNYISLMDYLRRGKFEVRIIGMSCGLSDRVMLKEVFEHKDCERIKIFYHKDQSSFIDTAQNISRHFTNKGEFRKRIVNFEHSEPCPQASSSPHSLA